MEAGSTDGVFTRYVRELEPGSDPPAPSNIAAVWNLLRKLLHWELRRRGLWQRPPRYLGVYGWPHWSAPASDGARGDALGELTADAFSYIFVQRLAALRAQLAVKPNVEGLVRLNVKYFVQELQERHDPLGARIFTQLRRVVGQCVDAGFLLMVSGDQRIGNDSILAFPGADPESRSASEEDVSSVVATWCDDLLPDLVTTRGKGQHKLEARLTAKVCELERAEIGVFAFQDLVRGLRREARRRWIAAFDRRHRTDWGVEMKDEDVFDLVPLVSPDTSFEARQSLRWLLDCVGRRLAVSPLDSRSAGELEALWDTLVGWSVETGATDRDSPPSHREIVRLLGIPRHRLPGLYDRLRKLVRSCGQGRPESAEEPPGGSTPGMGGAAMQDQDLQARLHHAATEAAARAARAEGDLETSPPGPGDVYVLRPSADRPVEWVIVEADGEQPGWWIAVPADTRTRAGSADLPLDTDAPGGPLTLRCGLALPIPSTLLEPRLRSRRLATRDVQRARDRLRRLADGSFEAQAPREIDPSYQEALEPAAAARAEVAASLDRPGAPLPFPTARARPPRGESGRVARLPRFRRIEALAAVLALATVGLSVWTAIQQDRLRRFEAPDFEPAVSEIRLNADRRTPEPWKLRSGGESLVLYLVLREPYSCTDLRMELTAADGRRLWSRELEMGGGEVKLVLPRRFLEREPRHLRVFDLCGGEPRLLEELPLTLVWE